jgi:hypothetical protein
VCRASPLERSDADDGIESCVGEAQILRAGFERDHPVENARGLRARLDLFAAEPRLEREDSDVPMLCERHGDLSRASADFEHAHPGGDPHSLDQRQRHLKGSGSPRFAIFQFKKRIAHYFAPFVMIGRFFSRNDLAAMRNRVPQTQQGLRETLSRSSNGAKGSAAAKRQMRFAVFGCKFFIHEDHQTHLPHWNDIILARNRRRFN